MNRQEILAKLRENEAVLRARGVDHAALFGSRARGDARPDSDIDLMVEFDPAPHVTVFNYTGLKDYIAGLFDDPVDVVSREGVEALPPPRGNNRRDLCVLMPRLQRCATSRIPPPLPPPQAGEG